MDDYMFPAYVSPKLRSKSVKLGDVGDAFVRELEFSKITLRLVDKNDPKDDSDEHSVAKLAGDTFTTLQRILVRGFLFSVTAVLILTLCSTTQRNWPCVASTGK